MVKSVCYKKLNNGIKVGYIIDPQAKTIFFYEALLPKGMDNDDKTISYISEITGQSVTDINDKVKLYEPPEKESFFKKISSVAKSFVKQFSESEEQSLDDVVDVETVCSEVISLSDYLKNSEEDSIELIFNPKRNMYSIKKFNELLTVSTKENDGLNLIDIETYLLFKENKFDITDKQYAYISGTEIGFNGSGYITGYLGEGTQMNITKSADINITDGRIHGKGYMHKVKISDGRGIIGFDGTEINGKVTLKKEELKKFITTWMSNADSSDTEKGYICIENEKCPVTELTLDWALKNIKNKIGEITIKFDRARVWGNVKVTDFNAEVDGYIDAKIDAKQIAGCLENFKAEMNGGLCVDNSGIELKCGFYSRLWMNGNWRSIGDWDTKKLEETRDPIVFSDVEGYISVDMEKIVNDRPPQFIKVDFKREKPNIKSYKIKLSMDNSLVVMRFINYSNMVYNEELPNMESLTTEIKPRSEPYFLPMGNNGFAYMGEQIRCKESGPIMLLNACVGMLSQKKHIDEGLNKNIEVQKSKVKKKVKNKAITL